MSPIVATAESGGTPAPVVSASLARVKITATTAPVAPGQPDTGFVSFRWSADGAEWPTVRGYERVDAEPNMAVVAYDYEAPPNTQRLYIAQAGRVLNGADIISSRSSAVAATVVPDSWWLKDPLDPLANMKVTLYRGRSDEILEMTSTERRDDSVAIGRKYASSLSDVIEGERFERTFTFTEAELDAFENLRDRRRTLLLQDMHGRGKRAQYYVRLGAKRSVTKLVTQGFETDPLYRLTIEFEERARP